VPPSHSEVKLRFITECPGISIVCLTNNVTYLDLSIFSPELPWIRDPLRRVLYELTTKQLFVLPRAFSLLNLCYFPGLLVLCTSVS